MERKDEMGKRFASVIGVAAAGVMALGAQTATSSTVEPVDSIPPDVQLSGKKKQKLGKAVKVKASCGDEACTLSAEGELYWWFEEGGGKAAARMATHELPGVKHDKLKPAGADVGPGETTQLKLKLKEKTRKKARKALDKGKNVQADLIVYATDAAGNTKNAPGENAQRAIRLVK
jgi:hypothetical protein